jgi:hypothetical protein
MTWTEKDDKDHSEKLRKLSRAMLETMSELCVNALYVLSKRVGAPLNQRQIDEVIDTELSQILKNLQDLKTLEGVKTASKKKFDNLKPFQ